MAPATPTYTYNVIYNINTGNGTNSYASSYSNYPDTSGTVHSWSSDHTAHTYATNELSANDLRRYIDAVNEANRTYDYRQHMANWFYYTVPEMPVGYFANGKPLHLEGDEQWQPQREPLRKRGYPHVFTRIGTYRGRSVYNRPLEYRIERRGTPFMPWVGWIESMSKAPEPIDPWVIWVEGLNTVQVLANNEEEAIERAAEHGYNAIREAEVVERERREAEHVRLAEEERQRVAERKRKVNEAREKALKLLKDHLLPAQLERFEKDKCIPVDTPSGNKYLIRHGRSANIGIIKHPTLTGRKLCAHPSEMVPDYDTMLAQKLFLENSEEEFLRVANVH